MNKEPLVSVIMSEYNTDEKLLKDSIESIINQTYKNFELILIDDCGKNNLEDIVNKFDDPRINIYKNERNMGLVYSLNKALKYSKGKYIARMDTDDYSLKDRLKIQVDFMEEHPDIDLISSNMEYYDGDKVWGRTYGEGEITREKLLKGSPIAHPTVMAKREVMNNVGGYPDYKRCEDYAMWIELSVNNYKMYKILDVLLRYHLSIDDYKKRTLKTRKDFFRLLNTQYKKLNPKKTDVVKMKIKTLLAGIMPYRIMYSYHKRKVNN